MPHKYDGKNDGSWNFVSAYTDTHTPRLKKIIYGVIL